MKNYDLSNEKDIKDLAYHLKKNLSKHNIKHTEILEAISKSLGFNNWNIFMSLATENSENIVSHKYMMSIFKNGNCEEIVSFILSKTCYDFRELKNSPYLYKAFDLIYATIKSLIYKRDFLNLEICTDSIKNALIIDSLIKDSYSDEMGLENKQEILSYLTSLPKYKHENEKQDEVTYDCHGYLQMQFTKCLGDLDQIENPHKDIYSLK